MLRPYIDHAPRAAFAASIASWVPATARTSPTRSRSPAVGTSTPPSARVIARTVAPVRPRKFTWASVRPMRSEEHTSELQSLTNLVCRLLLEKKKKIALHTIQLRDGTDAAKAADAI